MFILALVVAFLFPVQVEMTRVDTGAIIQTVQTQPLRGPGGESATLRISSADDHSKDNHSCEADYQLVLNAGSNALEKIELLTSDDDYQRPLSGRISGFSHDGKLILGILAEGSEHASTMLFVYDTASHATQVVDLGQRFAGVLAKKCAASFDIVGTADHGGIVIKLDSASHCAPEGRFAP